MITPEVMDRIPAWDYFALMQTTRKTAGEYLRAWRGKRRMSQLELASEAEISTRHLSFLETSRSQASREMLLHLSEQLDIPLRERNIILVAAGYAPVFEERPLASPEMAAARQAVERVLNGHEPFPALAVDRRWQLVSANAAVAPLLAGVDEALLKPPVNVLRLSLHPGGLAPRIANLTEWRAHLLMRLRTQIEHTADPALIELLAELSKFPSTNLLKTRMPPPRDETAGVFVPFQLVTDTGKLSFLSTTAVFGTPIDVTLSELALECFFPADDATAQALQR
jgi:transcriptional regulator with XRE-family HTH domain